MSAIGRVQLSKELYRKHIDQFCDWYLDYVRLISCITIQMKNVVMIQEYFFVVHTITNILPKSQVNQMDDKRRAELGTKLVMHSKGPRQLALEYNHYVVNGMLFRTLSRDEGKTTQNSGVCVPTIDGNTYYGKLTRIIEIEYYDTTRYVLFKCDWADIKINKGYKEDEYGFSLVNFKNRIHTGEKITDDPYVLSSQISQVYYVEDERHPDWAVVVKTKPRNVFDVGQGEVDDDDDDASNYHENEPFNLNTSQGPNDVDNDLVECARNDVAPTEVQNSAGTRRKLYDILLMSLIADFILILYMC
jgi:hypothetical protein